MEVEVKVSGGLRRAGKGEEWRVVAAANVGVMGGSVCDEGEMDHD